MKILSLETSTTQGSIAIWQGRQFLFSKNFPQPRGRAGALLQILEQAIKMFGSADCIAIGTGPGSYNGIRAAIAVAEGLRLAWKASVLGIPSLLAVPSPAQRYAVVGDARGNSFFFGAVINEHLEDLRLFSAAEFRRRLETWQGPIYAAAPLPEFPHLILQAPTAEKLATLAATQTHTTKMPTPLYLKPPHITQPARAFIN
ncbi:MAG: tRNA (adenosine(37)-N6)-threonylcarbamoyltransferase complex dimerization subunit type 1 TsaB [Verrucomicrobia bacterium]|nr:MAG: tRNA (adenosine(37)-N6)-threonylcarbamoyltransferase complex dimerization subunit type 1 TsaB [Verrucomicrobiota bacterium]